MEPLDDSQKWKEQADKTFELLSRALAQINEELTFVTRTGFVSWLNAFEDRIARYINGDFQSLVNEYVNECIKEDEFEICQECQELTCECKKGVAQ